MTVPIGWLVEAQQRLEVYCYNTACDAPVRIFLPEEAVALVGADITFREAEKLFRCEKCGQRVAHCRASMSDYYYWLERGRLEGEGLEPPEPPEWMRGRNA